MKSGPFTMIEVFYKRYVVNVLRRQIEIWQDNNCVMLRPCSSEMEKLKVNHPMNGSYFKQMYDTLREEVMKSNDRDVMWSEWDNRGKKQFSGLCADS